jgi:hypothetical protein
MVVAVKGLECTLDVSRVKCSNPAEILTNFAAKIYQNIEILKSGHRNLGGKIYKHK